MTAGIEVYASDGLLLLSSESLVLNTAIKEVAILNSNYTMVDSTGNTFDPQTMNRDRWSSTYFIMRNTPLGYDYHSWFMPVDGSTVLTAGVDSYALRSTSNNTSRAKIAYVSDSRPVAADSYLSVYNTAGNLMWSAGSIEKCPIILEKINLMGPPQKIIDLSSYGKPIEDIYLCATMFGSLEYGDTGVSYITGISTKRVGNLVYCAPYYYAPSFSYSTTNIVEPYYLYVGYLP